MSRYRSAFFYLSLCVGLAATACEPAAHNPQLTSEPSNEILLEDQGRFVEALEQPSADLHPSGPRVRSETLPPFLGEAGRCKQETREVDVSTWVEAADAIVIGTVVDISPANDLGYVALSDYPRKVIPGDECVGISGGFRIVLDDVTTLAGEEMSRVEIRIGMRRGWALDSTPTVSETVEWPPGARGRIEMGMRIGGALYHIEEYGFYSFESAAFQPFFAIENDVIAFQEMKGCLRVNLIPPISGLSGLTIEEFTEAIQTAEAEIIEYDREGNPLRNALDLYTPLEKFERRQRWFSSCRPRDWQEPVGECRVDADCPFDHLCENLFCTTEPPE